MKTPKFVKFTNLILATTISVFTASFVALANWSPPPAAPPNCPSGSPGCDAPIHVGSGGQAKSGALGIGGVFQANSSAYLAVSSGRVGIGTTSPSFDLDVSGTGRFTGALTLGTQASSTSHAVRADRTITAGTGLSGGGNLTSNRTINADTSYLQRRVSSCSAGQAIRTVSQTGSVSCVSVGSGTVTSVGTGTGLTGGTITTSGTISADTSYLQRRVSSCSSGQAIRTVSQTGSVSCVSVGSGTVTSVGTGTGLTGGTITTSGTISADTSYLQRKISCYRATANRTVSPGRQVSWSVLCNSGYTVMGGGVNTSNTGSVRITYPVSDTQFRCGVGNNTGSSQTYTCVAVCCQLF